MKRHVWDQRHAQRTLKYMLGIAYRKFIVNQEWVQQSCEMATVLPEVGDSSQNIIVNI